MPSSSKPSSFLINSVMPGKLRHLPTVERNLQLHSFDNEGMHFDHQADTVSPIGIDEVCHEGMECFDYPP